MNITVTYKRTIQAHPYEPLTFEATVSDVPVANIDAIPSKVAECSTKLEETVDNLILNKLTDERNALVDEMNTDTGDLIMDASEAIG
jgi:hypothetical protein